MNALLAFTTISTNSSNSCRRRPAREQGVDQPLGQGAVCLAGDPLVERPTELRLDADRAGAGADQDELADLVAARRGESLGGDPAHRVADHAAAFDAQGIEQRTERLGQSLRAGEAPPVVGRAERVQVDRERSRARAGPRPPAARTASSRTRDAAESPARPGRRRAARDDGRPAGRRRRRSTPGSCRRPPSGLRRRARGDELTDALGPGPLAVLDQHLTAHHGHDREALELPAVPDAVVAVRVQVGERQPCASGRGR